jgi:superfamily I DNA and/or RNA helicase
LNSEQICPSCQYQNILTLEQEDKFQKTETLQSNFEPDDSKWAEIRKVKLHLKLTNAAAKQIQDLAPRDFRLALSAGDEKKRSRDAAERWVRTHLNNNQFIGYVYNGGQGSEGDDLIEIRLATDENQEANLSICKEVNGGTLVLVGVEKMGDDFDYNNYEDNIFLLTEVMRLGETAGQWDKVMSIPIELTFPEDGYETGFDEEFLSILEALPTKDSHREMIQQKMSQWLAFLEIMRKNLPKSRYKVSYTSYRQGTRENEYIFTLSDRQKLPWKQIERSIGWFIHLAASGKNASKQEDEIDETTNLEDPGEPFNKLGKIDDIDKFGKKIVVILDANVSSRIENDNYRLPADGYLVYKNEGEETNIKRMEKGMSRLANRQSENVHLNDFIFDSRQACIIPEGSRLTLTREDFLNQVIHENREQKEAVEGALSAQDLYLIQGPPGTGKTTVIAEICYQIARKKGRTLIASQTNLAVDNVLSRLVHDKSIRSLRLGKAERVEEEGLPFIEERVIETWLTNTSQVQKFKLEQDRKRLVELEELLKHKKQIFHCLDVLRNNTNTIQEKTKELEAFEKQIQDMEKEIKRNKLELETLGKIYFGLDSLSTLEGTKGFEDLHKWIIEIPKSFREHFATFIRNAVQSLEDQVRNDLEDSSISLNLSGEKTFIRQISELINIKPRIEEEGKKNKSFVEDLSAALFQGMQLIDEMREIDLLRGRLDNYKKTRQTIFGETGTSSSSSENSFYDPQETYSGKIHEIESRIKNHLDNQTPIRVFIKDKLRRCEEIYPEILSRKLFENPNKISLQEVEEWENRTRNILTALKKRGKALDQLSKGLDLKNFVQILRTEITRVGDGIHTAQTERESQNSSYADQSKQITNHLRTLERQMINEKEWWDLFVANPPEILGTYRFDSFIENDEEFERFKLEGKNWQKEESALRIYLDKYETFVQEWIGRLDAKDKQDITELKQIYISNANVIGITCMQSASNDFQDYGSFDCVIVDEVTKATPMELILPLLKGRKLVLVGDHKQLPPMIDLSTFKELAESLKIPEDRLQHIKRALFQDLYEQAPDSLRTMLKIQYRMHPEIMKAINQFYGGALVCGVPNPDQRFEHGLESQPWLQHGKHLVWIDFPISEKFGETEEDDKSKYNQAETKIVESLVEQIEAFLEKNPAPGGKKKEVGVITFYAAQVERLNHLLLDRSKKKPFTHVNLRIGTVDRFQGMERPVIIASLVRNNDFHDIGFAKELARINVAFSRAQELLVIVGCHSLFAEEAKGYQGEAMHAYRKVFDLVFQADMVFPSSAVTPPSASIPLEKINGHLSR